MFASAGNPQNFKDIADKYVPSYGGWYAYATCETGEKVKMDPETFKIIDGKVYLLYNFWGNNTLKDRNKNEKPPKAKADQNWKKLIPWNPLGGASRKSLKSYLYGKQTCHATHTSVHRYSQATV